MADEAQKVEKYDLIQAVPSHKWGGCILVVDEVKGWGGVLAYIEIPSNDGKKGTAFIFLEDKDYEPLGAKVNFVPKANESVS